MVTFRTAVDRSFAENPREQFAQCWNYRYGAAYGSPEMSPSHPGAVGHDPLAIRSAHAIDDRTVFFEIPDLQPVNQVHLRMKVDGGDPLDLFATVHKPAESFTGFPGYKPGSKTLAVHPMLRDLASMRPAVPNRFRAKLPNAREVVIEAGKNLTFAPSSFAVKAGEPIKLTFRNPDVVPHNWALIQPGTLAIVGDLANKLVADPEAATAHYMPKTDSLIAYADVVEPGRQFSIFFEAPKRPGKYPYLCTFPGHWMVMNGVMSVE